MRCSRTTRTRKTLTETRPAQVAGGRLGLISEDPIGFAAGDMNVARYVGNGVTGAVDPSGLDDIAATPAFDADEDPVYGSPMPVVNLGRPSDYVDTPLTALDFHSNSPLMRLHEEIFGGSQLTDLEWAQLLWIHANPERVSTDLSSWRERLGPEPYPPRPPHSVPLRVEVTNGYAGQHSTFAMLLANHYLRGNGSPFEMTLEDMHEVRVRDLHPFHDGPYTWNRVEWHADEIREAAGAVLAGHGRPIMAPLSESPMVGVPVEASRLAHAAAPGTLGRFTVRYSGHVIGATEPPGWRFVGAIQYYDIWDFGKGLGHARVIYFEGVPFPITSPWVPFEFDGHDNVIKFEDGVTIR